MGGEGVGAAEAVGWSAVEGSGLLGPGLERLVLGARRRPMVVQRCSDPVRWNWWLLRFFNAFGLGVRLLLGLVLLAAGFFGVVDGGEDARLVILRLKLVCASFAVLVSSLFFYLLVFGSVLCFLLFNTSMKNQS